VTALTVFRSRLLDSAYTAGYGEMAAATEARARSRWTSPCICGASVPAASAVSNA